MRAITINGFGDVPELTDQPIPEPGPGEVQVAVEAAATNPLDLAIASGSLQAIGEYRFPLTLGMDGAGVVTAVGEGVTEFRVGERVFGQFWGRPLRCGTFAEVAVVQAVPTFGALATIPDDVPSHVAAALPTSGMTALGALEHLRVPDGGTLLVIGGPGGVGSFALELALAAGVKVIATASNAEQLRDLDVEVVLRGQEPLEDVVRRTRPDAVLDTVGDREVMRRVQAAAQGATVLSTAFGLDDPALNYRLDRKPERLAAVRGLQPVIGLEVPLEDAPRVLKGEIKSPRGKTVLRVA
ncbi:NADP-dependent oxidoreductase [Lentzea sp. JNUCC 0626]|uniref:NADP-dependent oxidoreductase n=1 Tax=Lentzea sp. JNUCC 0626 TaxID=3367513 RepID=UPI0037497A9E